MKLEMEPYKPLKHANFWCHKCDRNTVDSLNEESGSFFVMFGHSYSQQEKGYTGVYTGVMFAMCKPCLDIIN